MKITGPVARPEEIDRNPDLDDSLFSQEDPVAILNAQLRMVRRRDRARIGFDHADLNTLSKAWGRAAIAGCGDLEFLQERDRYAKLLDQLKSEMLEHRQELGLMFLESRDWSKPLLIERAIARLEYAEINTIH